MNPLVYVSLFTLLAFVSCKSADLPLGDESADQVYIPKRIESGKTSGYCYTADKADSSESFISFEYYTPQFSSNVMDSSYKDSVNTMIYRMIQFEFIEDMFDQETSILTDNFFSARLDFFLRNAQEEVDYLESTPWSMELNFHIVEKKSFVRLNHTGWDYTGGAHGNYWDMYHLFDKKSGRILSLSDFINDIDALNRLALPYFREQNEIPDDITLEEYGFWFQGDAFEVNENFYFENGNIVFLFNPYEIAPYAGGTSELIIPLSDLGDLFLGIE